MTGALAPPPGSNALADIEECHRQAVLRGAKSYTDPSSGYKVLTSSFLQERGTCCGNGCRHCPYGHANVTDPTRRVNVIEDTVVLVPRSWRHAPGDNGSLPVSVLFWSGGKDSYLTFRHVTRTEPHVPLVLLTTFGQQTQRVSIQDIHIHDVVEQAKALSVPICAVPLAQSTDYPLAIEAAIGQIEARFDRRVDRLVFGDLHLEDIREWRVSTFSGRYRVCTPLFNVPYKQLLDDLWSAVRSGEVSIVLSAVELDDPKGVVGQVYDEEFVANLPAGCDIMGENGEFHTHVIVHTK